MTRIRDDLDGVVYAPGPTGTVRLAAGDMVPDGVNVGTHLLRTSTATEPTKPTKPAGDAVPDGAPKGNASRDEWAAYATTLGVDVPDGAKRDDIKALIEAAAAHQTTTTDDGGVGDTSAQD